MSDATSGGSDDYMKGKVGVKYVYLMELPPSSEGFSVYNIFLQIPKSVILKI